MSDDIKARLTLALKCPGCIPQGTANLLQSCLKHIEELERMGRNAKQAADDFLAKAPDPIPKADVVSAVALVLVMDGEKISQLQSQLRERDEALNRANSLIGAQAQENDKLVQSLNAQLSQREADCAAMREAFDQVWDIEEMGYKSNDPEGESSHSTCNKCEAQLPHGGHAENCPQPIIEKALSTTAGRELLERLQKAQDERRQFVDTIRTLHGTIADLREGLQKVESVLLKVREIGELANWHKCSDHAWPEWCVMKVVNEALQPKEAK